MPMYFVTPSLELPPAFPPPSASLDSGHTRFSTCVPRTPVGGVFCAFWDKDVKILRRAGPGLVRDMCVILEYPSSSRFRISCSYSLNSKMSVVSPGLSDSIESPVMKCFETAKIPLGPGIWGPGAGPAAQGSGLGPAARTPGPRPGRRGPGHHRDAYPFYLSARIRSIKLRSGPRPWTAGRRLPTVTKLLMNNSSSM